MLKTTNPQISESTNANLTDLTVYEISERSGVQPPKGFAKILAMGFLCVISVGGDIGTFFLLPQHYDPQLIDFVSYISLLFASPIFMIVALLGALFVTSSHVQLWQLSNLEICNCVRIGGLFWTMCKVALYSKRYLLAKAEFFELARSRIAREDQHQEQKRETEESDRNAVLSFESQAHATLASFSTAISSIQVAYGEARRAYIALTGNEMPTSQQALVVDVTAFCAKLGSCYDVLPPNLSVLYHCLVQQVETSDQRTLSSSCHALNIFSKTYALGVPGTIVGLNVLDAHIGSRSAPIAARFYLSLAEVARELCPQSRSSEAVLTAYARILSPYLQNSDAGTGQSTQDVYKRQSQH